MAVGVWHVVYDGALTCGALERGQWVVFGDCVASARPSEKIKQKWSQTIVYRLPDRSFVAEIRVSTVLLRVVRG